MRHRKAILASCAALLALAFPRVWGAEPAGVPTLDRVSLEGLRTSLDAFETPYLAPQSELDEQALSGLAAELDSTNPNRALTARVLATALSVPHFIESQRGPLARLMGHERLSALSARAAALAANPHAAPAQRAALAERVSAGLQELDARVRELDAAIDSLGGSMDGNRAAAPWTPDTQAPALENGEDRELRAAFMGQYEPRLHRALLADLGRRVLPQSQLWNYFRICETPTFLQEAAVREMAEAGRAMLLQLIEPDYLEQARRRIELPSLTVRGEEEHPVMAQVDFGQTAQGMTLKAQTVEMQGFPTIIALMRELAQSYQATYPQLRGLRHFLSGLNDDGFVALLRQAVLGSQDPEQVILLEHDPLHQKTLPDFLATEKLMGVRTVALADVIQRDNKLYYRRDGRLVQIKRIYNRVIEDDLPPLTRVPFDFFNPKLEVEWIGHPYWYKLISKLSLSYLSLRNNPFVPETNFLDRLPGLDRMTQEMLNGSVLKPLFAFAGKGVEVPAGRTTIEGLSPNQRELHILQRLVNFTPFMWTPEGLTKVETRVIYLWLTRDNPIPVLTLTRATRGEKGGADANKTLPWSGVSLAFFR